MINAHCVDQEYWILQRTKCECGLFYKKTDVLRQELQDGPSDVLFVQCSNCGRANKLAFNISSFFGKPDFASFEKVCKDKDIIWKLFVSDSLKMESVIGYLRRLADDGDFLAPQYIEAACQHFISKKQP